MLKSNYKTTNNVIINSLIELGDDLGADTKGKGRKFVSKFIEPGVAHYEEFGDVLITKETLDKFINTMVGAPVIIKHKDITDENADKERVGVISNVWFNQMDGWYYCDGIIWDKQAIDLVKNQGWNVSCTYDFESDKQPKTHNGKKIDMEFTDGEFLHLALVDNPRYERANIVMNAKDKDEDIQWVTVKGNHIPIKKGQSKEEAVKEFIEKQEGKSLDKKEDKKIGEALYLINKQAKAYRDAISYVKGFSLPSKQIDEVLSKELGIKVQDGKIKIGDEEISAEYDSFNWYTEKDFLNESDKKLWKEIKNKLFDIRLKNISPITKKMDELYSYKDKLIKQKKLKPIDKHKFKQGDSYIIRDLYKIGDFEFHGKDDTYYNYTEEERANIPFLDAISSDVKIDTSMSTDEAVKVIKKYIASNSLTSIFAEAIAEVVTNCLGELRANNKNDGDKWITIKPHGDDADDYKRLKLQAGETPKEAMKRVYGVDVDKKEGKKEETISYKSANTITEALENVKNYVEENGFKIKNISLDKFNQLNKTLDLVKKQYGYDKLKEIGLSRKKTVYAEANQKGLWINKDFLEGSKEYYNTEFERTVTNWKENSQKGYESAKRDVEKGWKSRKKDIKYYENRLKFDRFEVHTSAENYYEDTILHELGHVISLQKIIKDRENAGKTTFGFGDSKLERYKLTYAETETAKLMKSTLAKAKETGDIHKISYYANTNADEFFAECFVMHQRKEKLPDYINTMITKIIEK